MPARDYLSQIPYIGKRLFGYGEQKEFSFVDKFTGPSKDINFLNTYSGVAYACINAISEEVGKYEPYFYTIEKGKEKIRPTHPFIDVLHRPNPDASKYDLLEGTQTFMEIFGEAFWYMVPGNLTGQPKEIYLLRPDRVGIDVNTDNGEVNGYYLNNGSEKILFEPTEILHFRTFNPYNPYRGLSTVQAALDYIQTEEAVSQYTKNFFTNNAGLSGVLSIQGQVSQNAWKKFVQQWRERYEGVQNAGKVALVRDTEINFTKVGMGLNEIDMQALKQMTLEQVFMMFRVPKGILGLESDQGLGRASVETLEYIFAKRTIEPKLSRIDDTLQRAMDRYYPKDKLIVGHHNMVPADKEFELKERVAGVDLWVTRNEVRDQEGFDALTGGDVLRAPIQSIPLSDTPLVASNTSSSTASFKMVKNSEGRLILEATTVEAKKKDLAWTVETKENFRLSLQRNQKGYEHKFKTTIEPLIKAQKQLVLERIKHLGKDISSDLFDLSEAAKDWKSTLLPVITDLYLTQGGLALEYAGASDTKFDLNQSIIFNIAQNLSRMADNFNTSTLDMLSTTLAEGINSGENIKDLSQRVSDIYDGAEGWRADRLARTETLDASNDATRDAYKQTGYVTAMQWYANPGACEFCDELDGKTVGLDDTFANVGESITVGDNSYQVDYADVETPPLHPNCSCTIVPVTIADN